MKFKDLYVGDHFRFASEDDPNFRYSGIERGPWVKVSQRCYVKSEEVMTEKWDGVKCEVGTIDTNVILIVNR